MNGALMLGLAEALYPLNEQIEPLPGEELALLDAADRSLGAGILALVDSPSVGSIERYCPHHVTNKETI